MNLATHFIAGFIFAIGLVVGGMTQPSKIIAFLDVSGDWDPSLGFVMVGAIGVHALTYRLIMKRPTPLFAREFYVPRRNDIDARLLVGAALFGVGWGLGGYCPGPALVAAGGGVPDALVFLAATMVGHWLFGRFNRWSQKRGSKSNEQATSPQKAVHSA